MPRIDELRAGDRFIAANGKGYTRGRHVTKCGAYAATDATGRETVFAGCATVSEACQCGGRIINDPSYPWPYCEDCNMV